MVMNMEQNQLQNARNELGVAIKLLNEQIKLFAAAHVTYANAKILGVGNHVLDSFKKMKSNMDEYRAKKIMEREEKREERETEFNRMMAEQMEEKARHERTKEHADAIDQIFKEEERRKRAQRIIQIRYGAIQKTKSVFSKLGSVKKNVLQKINQTKNTFDLKVSNAFEKAKLTGLQIGTKALELANGVKGYTSEQIAKFAAWRYEKDKERAEKREEQQAEVNRMMADQMEEKARHERTKEHADAIEQIFKEEERQKRAQRIIQIRYGAIQKTKSVFSKLGSVKKNVLQKINQTRNTFDLKVSNAFEKAKLTGLRIGTKVLELANGVKGYTSEQIAEFAAWRYEKDKERAEKREEQQAEVNRMIAEQMEEEARQNRTKEHVDAMKEILKAQDRQALLDEQREIQEQMRIQNELLQAQRQQLFGDNHQEEASYNGRIR